MAIPLVNKTNVDAPNSAYPYGKIRDNNGTGNGTPVNEQVYGDMHQFFAKMLAESGIVANGLPDNSTNGFQYYEALLNLFSNIRVKKKVIEIGDWDMNANGVKSVAHGVDHKKIRAVSVIIRDDIDTGYSLFQHIQGQTMAGGGLIRIETNLISLKRFSSGEATILGLPSAAYQNDGYDSTGYNRGWITVEYEV